jgi:PPOX class probable F420-dependent enzyme
VVDLARARDLGARESGLAVAITTRPDGSPRASVVNAGVVEHPLTGQLVVGFVSRGAARKLVDLRALPRATVVFRSGWDWVAVEGDVTLVGPDDHVEGLAERAIVQLIRAVYAAAVGGTPEQWGHLDATMAEERHAAVLIRPSRVYPPPTDPRPS